MFSSLSKNIIKIIPLIIIISFIIISIITSSASFYASAQTVKDCVTESGSISFNPTSDDSITININRENCNIVIEDVAFTSTTVQNIIIEATDAVGDPVTTLIVGATLTIRNVVCHQGTNNPSPNFPCVFFAESSDQISFSSITIDNVKFASVSNIGSPDTVAIIRHSRTLGGIDGPYIIRNIIVDDLAWNPITGPNQAAKFSIFQARTNWGNFKEDEPNAKLVLENCAVNIKKDTPVTSTGFTITVAEWANTIEGMIGSATASSGSIELRNCHVNVPTIARIVGNSFFVVALMQEGVAGLRNLLLHSCSVTVIKNDPTTAFSADTIVTHILRHRKTSGEGYVRFDSIVATNNTVYVSLRNVQEARRIETYCVSLNRGALGNVDASNNNASLGVIVMNQTNFTNIATNVAYTLGTDNAVVESSPFYTSGYSSGPDTGKIENIKLLRISDVDAIIEIEAEDTTLYGIRLDPIVNSDTIEFMNWNFNVVKNRADPAEGRIQFVRCGGRIDGLTGRLLFQNNYFLVQDLQTLDRAQDLIMLRFEGDLTNFFQSSSSSSSSSSLPAEHAHTEITSSTNHVVLVENNTLVVHSVKAFKGIFLAMIWFHSSTVRNIQGNGFVLRNNEISLPVNSAALEASNGNGADEKYATYINALHFRKLPDQSACQNADGICPIEFVSQILIHDFRIRLDGKIQTKGIFPVPTVGNEAELSVASIYVAQGRGLNSIDRIVVTNVELTLASAPSNLDVFISGEKVPLVNFVTSILLMARSTSLYNVSLLHVSDCLLSMYQQRIVVSDNVVFATAVVGGDFHFIENDNQVSSSVNISNNDIRLLDDQTAANSEAPSNSVLGRESPLIVEIHHLWFQGLVQVKNSLTVSENKISFPQTPIGDRADSLFRDESFISVLTAFDLRATISAKTSSLESLVCSENTIEQVPSPLINDGFTGNMRTELQINLFLFGCENCIKTSPPLVLSNSQVSSNSIDISGMQSRVVSKSTSPPHGYFSARILQANPLFPSHFLTTQPDATKNYQLAIKSGMKLHNNSLVLASSSSDSQTTTASTSPVLEKFRNVKMFEAPILDQVTVSDNTLRVEYPTMNNQGGNSIISVCSAYPSLNSVYGLDASTTPSNFETTVSGNEIIFGRNMKCDASQSNGGGACVSVVFFDSDRTTRTFDGNNAVANEFVPDFAGAQETQTFNLMNNAITTSTTSSAAWLKASLLTIDAASSLLAGTNINFVFGNYLRRQTPIVTFRPQIAVSVTPLDDQLTSAISNVFLTNQNQASITVSPCNNSFTKEAVDILDTRVSQIFDGNVEKTCLRYASETETYLRHASETETIPVPTPTTTLSFSESSHETKTESHALTSTPTNVSRTASIEVKTPKFQLPDAAVSEGVRAAMAVTSFASPTSALAARRLFGVAQIATCALRVQGRRRSGVQGVQDTVSNNDNDNNDGGDNQPPPPQTTEASNNNNPFTTRPPVNMNPDAGSTIEDEVLDVLSWDSNIFMISISGYPENFGTWRGAVVSFCVLVIVWILLSVVMAVVRNKNYKVRKLFADWKEELTSKNKNNNDNNKKNRQSSSKPRKTETWEESFENVHFPSSVFVPASIYAPAVATVVGVFIIAVATKSDFQTIDLIILVVAMIVSVLVPCCCVAWVSHRAHTTQSLTIEPDDDDDANNNGKGNDEKYDDNKNRMEKMHKSMSTSSSGGTTSKKEPFLEVVKKKWNWLIQPQNEWKDSSFINRFGMVFDTLSHPWFAFLDFAVAISISIVAGIALLCPDQKCCTAVGVSSIVISAIHLFALIAMRPFLRRFEAILLASCSVVTLIISILSMVIVESDDGGAQVQGEVSAVTLTGFVLGILCSLIAILEVVLEFAFFFLPSSLFDGSSSSPTLGSRDDRMHHRHRGRHRHEHRHEHDEDDDEMLLFENNDRHQHHNHNHHHYRSHHHRDEQNKKKKYFELDGGSPSLMIRHDDGRNQKNSSSQGKSRSRYNDSIKDRDRSSPRHRSSKEEYENHHYRHHNDNQRDVRNRRNDYDDDDRNKAYYSSRRFKEDFLSEGQRREPDDKLAERLLESPQRRNIEMDSHHQHHRDRGQHHHRQFPSSRRQNNSNNNINRSPATTSPAISSSTPRQHSTSRNSHHHHHDKSSSIKSPQSRSHHHHQPEQDSSSRSKRRDKEFRLDDDSFSLNDEEAYKQKRRVTSSHSRPPRGDHDEKKSSRSRR